MSDIVIRRAEERDVPAISMIEEASFETPWSVREIARDVALGDSTCFIVASEEGDVIGFSEMRLVAGEAQIYNIAVAPESRGRGAGESLLRYQIDKAKESGCSVVDLDVRAGNTAALALYKKAGFKEVGRRKDYYGPDKDAVLMDLDLTQAAQASDK